MMHETGTGVDPTAALIKHVLFPAWVRKNRSTRLAYLEQFERSQFLRRWEIQELQWTQFKRLLQHAYDHCAFYRRKLSAIGMVPADVRTPDDIAHVPTTSKEEIQEWMHDLIADNVAAPLIKDMTGGSTGSPMTLSKFPSIPSTINSPLSWIPYAPALSSGFALLK